MSKNRWLKEVHNCGRKRKYKSRADAEEQKKARWHDKHQVAKVYKCDKCNYFHTARESRLTASSSVWSRLKQPNI